ncbi:hypothetical protein [Mitsuaria sp. 7]|uniref:hypothetical protein n=1 Tax=Mitsuaria sp. 7 TaxID=1658665 RepID=UPI0007DE0BAE|nr:hypothetical protein [Mitsuaria sp. 7]ANH69682.1 hypothetical protein ABE85_22670 [Mitsuaria sp. 7]
MLPGSLPSLAAASAADTDAGPESAPATDRASRSEPSWLSTSDWHRCSDDFDRCTLVELQRWVWVVMAVTLRLDEDEPWCHHAERAVKAQEHLNTDRPDPDELASIRAWLHQVRRDAGAMRHPADPAPRSPDTQRNEPARDGVVPAATVRAGTSGSAVDGEALRAILKFRSSLPAPAKDLLREVRFIAVPPADIARGTEPVTSVGAVLSHGPLASMDEERRQILISGTPRQWDALEVEQRIQFARPERAEVSAIWLAVAHMLETVASPRGREDQFLRALHQEEGGRGEAEAPTRESLAVWLLARALTGHWPKDHRAVRFLRRFLGPPDGGQAFPGGS